MAKFDEVLRRERREFRLGNLEALGLLAVIALIVAAWTLYL